LLAIALVALAVPGCDRLRTYTEQEMIQRAKDFVGSGEWQKAIIELKNTLQKNPNSTEARLLLGQIYVEKGRGFGIAAEIELKRAIDMGVNRDSVRVLLGTALITQGQFQRALEEATIGQNASDAGKARLLVVQGMAMRGLGRLAEGCKQFTTALELDREYLPAYWGAANCDASQGRLEEARTQLQAALKLAPKDGPTWTELGNLERAAGRYKESAEAYDSALTYRPESLDALLGRATLRVQTNKLADAQKDLQAVLRLAPGHPIARQLRAFIMFRNGRYTEARDEFEKLAQAGGQFPGSVLWLGITELVLGNFERSSVALAAYAQMEPGQTWVQALLGFVRASIGSTDDARERLKMLKSMKIEDAAILAIAGSAYMVLGDSAVASDYYEKAVAAQPGNSSTRINFARARLRENDTEGAILQLKEAIKLKPDDPVPHEILVQVYIGTKRFDEALKSADALAALLPKSASPRIVKARVYLAKEDDASARTQLLQALEFDAGNKEAILMLALTSERQRDWAAAREWYEKLLKANKNDARTLLALYGMEVRAGQSDRAVAALERAIAMQPELADAALLLGRLYLRNGRFRQTLDATRVAFERDKNNPGLLQLRGAAFMALREYDSALAAYRQMEAQDPKSADAVYAVASVLAAQGANAEYRKALERALNLDPRHLRAGLAKTRVDFDDGRPDDALRRVRQLRRDYPGVVDAAKLESEILMAKGDKSGAVGVLAAFHQANPKSLDGAASLAKAYLFVKDPAKAQAVAREVLAAFPDEISAVALLTQAMILAGDQDGAQRVAREYAEQHPKSAAARYGAGELYGRFGKIEEAIKYFREALKLQPDFLACQQALAALEARAGRYAEALRIAEDVKRQRPSAAAGHVLEGDILIVKGDADKAAQAFRRAITAENTPDAAIRLHGALVAAKAAAEADMQLMAWLKDYQDEPAVREYFAQSLIGRAKNREAIEQYQILLKRVPGNWLAINNLANLYLLERDPRALATAEHAYALRPDMPTVLDTLGWIVFQRGDMARALKLLSEAVQKDPKDGTYQYHYAAVLAKSQKKQDAKLLLEKALSSGQRFPEENEAKALKDTL
jgi:putative PEP-CTERM system TPR-repeat lipoprotein